MEFASSTGPSGSRAPSPRRCWGTSVPRRSRSRSASAASRGAARCARSGIMLACGDADDPPLAIAGGVADQMGAVMLAYGVLAALLARERTGRGQEVDASHLGSMAWLQGLGLAARTMLGRAIPRQSRRAALNPLWNHYRCADDQWLALGMLQPDRYWARFCQVLDVPEAATDERFATQMQRMCNAAECVALLDEVFA